MQDATLRVWVTDIVSVVFGKDGKRSIIAMAPADSVAKGIANRLIDFVASQSAVGTLTAANDLERAASIGGLDAMVRRATTSAMEAARADAIGSGPTVVPNLSDADARIRGRVKFFDAAKGFGYIVADAGGEYFFNVNSFRCNAPNKGDCVEFQPERSPKGMMAKRILASVSE